MNYTGRPSISGCRPVLSLYPTHRFCQYLLLIFITFTNSFLFNRAFSTNSRRPLSLASLDSSPRGGGAQPLRHCFAMPPPLPRGGLGIAENFSSSPEAPLPGELSAKQTERLDKGQPDREALAGLNLSVTADAVPPPLTRGGLGIPQSFASSPEAPLPGATATTAASGGYRESLLGPRPAGCKRQRSRRWEPQPGLVERSETERLDEGQPDRKPLTFGHSETGDAVCLYIICPMTAA